MFSVRIIDADFYVTEPKPELDILYSKFRDSKVTRVPVVRIFGSTPSGQKTCLHVHQVFPYIFVPYDGTEPREKYLKQFATSVDFAVQVALGKATSSTHHVYKAKIVKRIPFYGYHEVEQEFIKIQFYNPRTVAKVVDLLQNGAILNKIFQPYESHIPYILQFLMDFNLYGMNLLHAKKVHFRGRCKIQEKRNSKCLRNSSSCFSSYIPDGSNSSFQTNATSWQHWNENTIPSDLCLGGDVSKTSRCELEVDMIADDILNKVEILTSIGRNPGIVAMWEDEKQRRRDLGQSSQISNPVSQDRGEMPVLDLETKFKTRIREIIMERNNMIQSQLEIMEKSLSPKEFQEFSQSISLDGKEPSSQTVINKDVDENIPVVDESVIENVLQASQSQPSRLSGQVDEDLVAILVSLAEDANEATPQECSPKANTTQTFVSNDEEVSSGEENEEEESIIMSQPVWNDDDLDEDCRNSSPSTDEADDDIWKPQHIPLLDRPADDDTLLLSNRSSTIGIRIKGDDIVCSIDPVKQSTGGDCMCSSHEGNKIENYVEECSSTLCLLTKRIPQLDGCHDDSDEDNSRLSKKKKMTVNSIKTVQFKSQNIEAKDEDDFKIKKKALIHGTKKNTGISKTRRHLTTRQRKSAIAQLNVRGGNFKKTNSSSTQSSTNVSEVVSTKRKRYLSLVESGSKTEIWSDEKLPRNLETCPQSSHPPSVDQGTLANNEAEKNRTRIKNKINCHTMHVTTNKGAHTETEDKTATKLNDFKMLKDDLCHLETESSESHTSDFELRLSVSSSDDEDFQCREKVPRITEEFSKLESLYVARKAPGEIKSKKPAKDDSLKNKECKARNTQDSGSRQKRNVCSVNRKFQNRKSCTRNQSGITKKMKSNSHGHASISAEQRHQGGEAHSITFLAPEESTIKSSKKCSGNNLDSRKRKRRRLKKTTCLVFTQIGNEPRANKTKLSKTENSSISENCFPETGEKTEIIERSEINSKLVGTICDTIIEVKKCPGNNGNKKKVEKQNERKAPGNVILLDACVKLEKFSVKKLKSHNNSANILERFQKLKDKSESLEDSLIDDELDSLYQMAMVSPQSRESDVPSPPIASSPSLNATSDDQTLDESLVKYLGNNATLDEKFRKDPEVQVTRNSAKLSLNEIDDDESVLNFSHGKDTSTKEFGTDEAHSLRQDTKDFPITFVNEEEVKIVCQSRLTSDMLVVEDLNNISCTNYCNIEHRSLENGEQHKIVSNHDYISFGSETLKVVVNHADDVQVAASPRGSSVAVSEDGDFRDKRVEEIRDTCVSPEISVVYDSFNVGDDVGPGMETGVDREMNAVSSGIYAVCDSFSIDDDEEISGMNIQELMRDIESITFEGKVTARETCVDINKQIKDVEISPVFDGKELSEDENDQINERSNDIGRSPREENCYIDKQMTDIESSPVFEGERLCRETNFDAHEMVNNVGSSTFESRGSPGEENVDVEDILKDIERSLVVEGKRSSKETNLETCDHFEKSDRIKIWRPATDPPCPSYILKTRDLFGLPHELHQKAFCSDPKDVPSARVVGGRRLQVSSLSVKELTEFDLYGNFQTLRELRGMTGSDIDNSLIRDCLRTLSTHGDSSDNAEYTDIPMELKVALMGEQEVVITPVRLPPSPKDVERWLKERVAGNQLISKPAIMEEQRSQESRADKIPEVLEVANTSKTENFQNSEKDNNAEIQVSQRSKNVIHSPNFINPTFDIPQMSLPMQDEAVSETIPPDVLIGPQHSTPFGNAGMKSRKFWHCTPIERDEASEKSEGCFKQDLEGKISRKEKHSKMISSRRKILNSQIKGQDYQDNHQASPCEASYIEGPTPTNSFGFKISQPNIQGAKSVRQVQHLTLLSVELHVRTRKSLRPDPEFDAICAIFYHVEHESKEGKEYVTGVIVVRNESTKLRRPDPAGTSDIAEEASVVNATSSAEILRGNSDRIAFEDSLLRAAGISHEVKIFTENEETDAINRFIKLVHEWDPDILLGFEVQMLSWGYLLQRALALGIDLAPQLSRVQDSSGIARFDAQSDQWGARHTSEISITGRIVLNVWRLMRHEVTLNVYSFENISYHVLHERVPLYKYRQLTRWWDQKLPHERWRTVEHYVIRCQGSIRILNHVDFINRTSEFARLYGILFYSVISRGSQFRVESMMLRLAKPMNYLAVSPSIQQRARMDAPECIALVMEPESRFYTDPVIVLDFQSLYPSMIIAYNYCYSTCLGRVSRLDKIGNFDFGCTALNVPPALLEKLENDIHVSANGAAFVKSNVRKGILPRMLEEILDTRVMVKKSMKEYKNDKVLSQLLDARQLALKLIANVTYGYTSANFSGRMPCVEIADAIVRKARETLERAIHLVNSRKEWGARVVYGDTDSLFVLVKGATKEEAFQIGQAIVEAVTAKNPKPVKLKFEKVYLPCVLQTKKRYVGYMYETLEQKEPVFDAKGIETVRRDTCPAVAKILEKSLRILFEEKDISLVKKFVQRQFRKLMEERVSIQDFIFAKEYRGMKSYKPTACVPALELARRQLSRDRRAEPRVGERVPYVVVNGSPGLPLIQLVRSLDAVLDDPSSRLNASYYINKQIIPPLNRVFSLIGIDVFTWYTELPRFVSRHRVTAGKQKSSISRYFTTLHCPVCEQLTQQGLCHDCRDNPQKAVIMLAERVGNWERKFAQLTEICFQCSRTRNMDIPCISLDCPVMFKRMQMRRKLEYGETLRDVQNRIEISNS